MKTILHKRLFCIVLACCFLQLCLPLQQIGGFVTTVFAAEEENVYDFAGGTGTEENPYRIETMFHLNNVRYYLDAYFIQIADIDLTDATADNGVLGKWRSIGTSSVKFMGSYNGNGNIIKGLQGNSLFGYVGENGIIQNLGIVDGNVVSYFSGSIAGENYGTINNCYNTSNVASDAHSSASPSGGISGGNNGIISNCYNTGNITSSDDVSGGISGVNNGIISNCYNTGNVTATSSFSSGGIVGENSGTIDNCYTLYELHFNEYGVKLAIEEMKQQRNFTGFDFDTVWTYDHTNEYQFPVLQNIEHIEKKENTTDFSGGNGTLYNPYWVSTAQQLNAVRNYLHDCFIQMEDIDLTDATAKNGIFYNYGDGWTSFDEFTGNYNGSGYVIKGLRTINKGLFSQNKGVIRNLGMINSNVLSYSSSGSIAGENNGTISNCYNTGNISATSYSSSGGIAGENNGTISNCYNTGDVTSYHSFSSGGIAGENNGTISNCYNTGNVSAASWAGGIAGKNNETINSCYNTGNISASWAGGIAGENNGMISNCYNTDNVTSSDYSGGITGENNGMISNCYNTGKITTTLENSTAGGLVGNTSMGEISTSYSIGEVSASGNTTRVGKVIGMNEGTTLSHLYYIGVASDMGVGNEGNGKGRVEFRTAEQMKTPSSLTGFDFDTIWAVDEGINNGFPFLYGVGNSLTPPSELPEGTLERSIKNLSYDSGKQAYTFTIAFKNTTGNAITTNVFAAAYDDSGRMTGLAIYDLTDLAAGSGTAIDAVIPAPQTAAYIKIICMDINTLVPVGAALKEEM